MLDQYDSSGRQIVDPGSKRKLRVQLLASNVDGVRANCRRRSEVCDSDFGRRIAQIYPAEKLRVKIADRINERFVEFHLCVLPLVIIIY